MELETYIDVRLILLLSSTMESINLSWLHGLPVSSCRDILTTILLPAFVQLLRMGSIQEIVSHVQSGNMDLMWAELYRELDGDNVSTMDRVRNNMEQYCRKHE